MSTLYAVGTRYDRMISVSGITTSTDGYTWTAQSNIVSPFLPHQSAIGVATNGTTISAISDDGYTASSQDGINWTIGSIIDGELSPRAVRYSSSAGIFMMVGTQKYAYTEPSHVRYDEVAQIFTNTSGIQGSWLMVYSQDDTSSILHGVRYVNSKWVACGVSKGNPLLLYSLDNGFSWVQVTLPDLFNGHTLFDVTYANGKYVFGARGVIINTPSLTDPVWNATDFVIATVANSDFLRINSNPSGHVVAVASGLIYYTLDGVEWHRYENPGYQFTCVRWFNTHWVVGCYSLLTHYTCFTSTDTVTWVGDNNSMHMYDFAVA